MDANSVASFDGTSIRYWSDGNSKKQTLVFIHGWCCKSEYWFSLKEKLSDEFNLVFVDLPSHGESDTPVLLERWKMNDLARDVEAVLNACGCREWFAVGHSMGGAVALELAILRPQSTRAVIAVDSLVYEPVYSKASDAIIDEFVSPLEKNFEETARAMAQGFLLDNAELSLVERLGNDFSKSRKEPAIAMLKELLRWDVDYAFKRTDVPIFGIHSEAFLTSESISKVEERMVIKPMKDVGHFVMMEDPNRFNALLVEVVTELSER